VGIGEGYPALLLLFVAGWTLMTVAMMLPTSLPLVAVFRSLVRRRRDGGTLVGLVVLGYLSIWTVFAFAVHLGDQGIHTAVERSGWLEANAWAIGAGTVLLAGAYQFTPLKYHCLEKCRSPMGFVLSNWHGGRGVLEAFRLGASRRLLPRLLLVPDARDVCRRGRQHRLDARPRRRARRREEHAVGQASERTARRAFFWQADWRSP
jgi:predicted metal-binding membrane protein